MEATTTAVMSRLRAALVWHGRCKARLRRSHMKLTRMFWSALVLVSVIAAGVLLGTGVGLAQVVIQENRASDATAMKRFSSDPAPTYRLALFRASF